MVIILWWWKIIANIILIIILNPFLRKQRVLIYIYISDQISRSVVSDSLQPHESQHARPPCPSIYIYIYIYIHTHTHIHISKDTLCGYIPNIILNSVHLLSRVQLFVTPWTAARQASVSITNSWSLLLSNYFFQLQRRLLWSDFPISQILRLET